MLIEIFNILPVQPVLGFAFLVPLAWALLGGGVAAGAVAASNATQEPSTTYNQYGQSQTNNSGLAAGIDWAKWLLICVLFGGVFFVYKKFIRKK